MATSTWLSHFLSLRLNFTIITAALLCSPDRKVWLKMIYNWGLSQPGSLVRNSVFDFFTGDFAFWIWGKAKLHPVSGTLQTKSLKKVNYLRSMKIVLCALQFPASSRSVSGRTKLPEKLLNLLTQVPTTSPKIPLLAASSVSFSMVPLYISNLQIIFTEACDIIWQLKLEEYVYNNLHL